MELGEKLVKELANNADEAMALMRIYKDLEGMRLIDAATDVDYLGQFYETFFRYTGASHAFPAGRRTSRTLHTMCLQSGF